MTIKFVKNATEKTITRNVNHVSQAIELTEVGEPTTGANIANAEHTEASWDALEAVQKNSPVHAHEHWDGTDTTR